MIPLFGAQKIAHAYINTSSPRCSHSKPSSKKRPISLLSLAKGRSPCASVCARVSDAGSRSHTSVGKRLHANDHSSIACAETRLSWHTWCKTPHTSYTCTSIAGWCAVVVHRVNPLSLIGSWSPRLMSCRSSYAGVNARTHARCMIDGRMGDRWMFDSFLPRGVRIYVLKNSQQLPYLVMCASIKTLL